MAESFVNCAEDLECQFAAPPQCSAGSLCRQFQEVIAAAVESFSREGRIYNYTRSACEQLRERILELRVQRGTFCERYKLGGLDCRLVSAGSRRSLRHQTAKPPEYSASTRFSLCPSHVSPGNYLGVFFTSVHFDITCSFPGYMPSSILPLAEQLAPKCSSLC